MSKILMYSDLHLRPERLDDCDIALTAIGKIADEKMVDIIINGADTFHTRGIVNTGCLDLLDRHWREWKKAAIKQIVLVGNHDQEDQAGVVHPLRVFDDERLCKVIDVPTFIGELGIAIFPYMDEVTEEIISVFAPKSNQIPVDAIVHWGIRGARRNDNNVDSDGVPVGWLKPFRRVFSGHYHFRNAFENVQYIGSPFEQDAGEANQEKGVLIWDNQTNELEFVKIEGTRRHLVCTVEWDENDHLQTDFPDEIKKNDFCKVIVKGDAERVLNFNKSGLKLSCEYVIDRQIREKSFSRLGIDSSEIHNTGELIQKYVDHVKTDLDKSVLLEAGQKYLEG